MDKLAQEFDGIKKYRMLTDEEIRRIVACINACEGFSTETLELAASGSAPSLLETELRQDLTDARNGWESATEELNKVCAQRDELREALKDALLLVETLELANKHNPQILNQCEAVWTLGIAAITNSDEEIARRVP